jgi:hypothetical protein
MSMPDPAGDRSRLQRVREVRHSGGYKTTTLLLSALLIGTIIVGAIYVAVSGDDGDNSPTPAFPQGTGQPSAQPAPPSVTVLPADAFGIPTTDQHGRRVETPTNPLGQVLPQTGKPSSAATITDPDTAVPAPAGLMWQRVNGFPIPFSTSDGPTSISADGVPSGFTRTPQGAVLAAWQIGQRAGWGNRTQTTALLRERIVLSNDSQPVADGMLGTQRDTIAQLMSRLPQHMFDVPVAVKVSNFDSDYAHVQIASPLPSGRSDGVVAVAVALDMVWREGTWKWVLPNAGVENGSDVLSLSGWTPW